MDFEVDKLNFVVSTGTFGGLALISAKIFAGEIH